MNETSSLEPCTGRATHGPAALGRRPCRPRALPVGVAGARVASKTQMPILRLAATIGAVVLLGLGNGASGAPVKVVLNYDSGGAGSFLSAIDTAATSDGLAANYFNADVAAIETGIQNELQRVYSGFNVTFTTTPDATARVASFGNPTDPNNFGVASFNWRNAFLPGTIAPANDAAAYADIYPANFGPSLSATATLAQNETSLEVAVGDTTAHELGHTFGLDHQDAYGDPKITPANYANTAGIQNTHIMASGATGLSNNRSTPRSFSQLEIAKLAQANNLYIAGGWTPNLIADAGPNHTQKTTVGANAAQALTLNYLPVAGESVVTVTSGSIGTGKDDVYSFTAAVGAPITADILAYSTTANSDGDPSSTPFFNTPANTTLSLWENNGGTPVLIASSNDKEYSGNTWISGTQTDNDPMILNQPAPATDTYYLDVYGVSAGNYEMFVSVPEPTALSLLAAGFVAMLIGRRLQRRSQI